MRADVGRNRKLPCRESISARRPDLRVFGKPDLGSCSRDLYYLSIWDRFLFLYEFPVLFTMEA